MTMLKTAMLSDVKKIHDNPLTPLIHTAKKKGKILSAQKFLINIIVKKYIIALSPS